MKRFCYLLLFATVSLAPGLIFSAQVNPKPENATLAVLRRFPNPQYHYDRRDSFKPAGIRLVPFFGRHS
jgi:hypothetical protein